LLASGGMIYAAGFFDLVGDKPRTNLAALDPVTGIAADWSPSISGDIAALAASSNIVFVAGSFTNVSGAAQTNLAALDRSTGALLDWAPAPNGRVAALAADNRTLFAGGFFTTIAGESRRRIASFDLTNTNLSLQSWQPEAIGTANSGVLAIVATTDRVYVGGSFVSIGGEFRTNLAVLSRRTGAAIDTATGSSVDWRTPANNLVWSLGLADPSLYVGGEFSSIGGQPRQGVALLESGSGTVTTWSPGASARVSAIVPTSSGVLVGGQFSGFTSGGVAQYRPNLAFFGPVGFSSLNAFTDGGGFKLQITGNVGELYEVNFSTNLIDWIPLFTNRLTVPKTTLQNLGGDSPFAFFRGRSLGP
jgi:hypothetical protein